MLKLVENSKGNFDIQKFGVSIAGKNADVPFDVVIETQDHKLSIKLKSVTAQQLFARIDSKGDHFQRDIYFSTDFICVEKTKESIMLKTTEAFIGTVKDLQGRAQVNNSSTVEVLLVSSKTMFKLEQSSPCLGSKKAA